MEIVAGIQPNCSEIVHQVTGLTQKSAALIKERVKEVLKSKYNQPYLEDYVNFMFAIKEKYCLNLWDFEGSDHIPDWDIVSQVCVASGFVPDAVDCCSNPIENDKKMEDYLESKSKDFKF